MSEIRSQATPARDELAEKIERWLTSADKIASTGFSHQKVRLCESMGFDWHETIAALQKALPRTVNSWDDIRPTVVATVIRDAHGDVFELWEDDDEQYWMTIGNDYGHQEPELPITVLFTPGDAG
ncbi:hypothetical protein [Rhodococcus sp. NPDC060176]|uniref:hypothetical protein n=1 Tax=Rhodococcus sp. NPDC060176 TaxID=3347062 RepID=UPI00365B84A4